MQVTDPEVQRVSFNYDQAVSSMVDTALSLNKKREKIGLFIQAFTTIVERLRPKPGDAGNRDVVLEPINIKDPLRFVVIKFKVYPDSAVISIDRAWNGHDVSEIPDEFVTPLFNTLPEIVKRLDENYPEFRKHYSAYINLV